MGRLNDWPAGKNPLCKTNHGISGHTGRFFLTCYNDFVSVYAESLAMDELDKIVSGHF